MSVIHFERKKLKNGLTVIYHSDPNTPFVVVNTLYKVGSKNESHHKKSIINCNYSSNFKL